MGGLLCCCGSPYEGEAPARPDGPISLQPQGQSSRFNRQARDSQRHLLQSSSRPTASRATPAHLLDRSSRPAVSRATPAHLQDRSSRPTVSRPTPAHLQDRSSRPTASRATTAHLLDRSSRPTVSRPTPAHLQDRSSRPAASRATPAHLLDRSSRPTASRPTTAHLLDRSSRPTVSRPTPAHLLDGNPRPTASRSRSAQRTHKGGVLPRERQRLASLPRPLSVTCQPHLYLEPCRGGEISWRDLQACRPSSWRHPYNLHDQYQLRDINPKYHLYPKKLKRFKQSTGDDLEVVNIQLVQNIHLWLMYQLKLQETAALHGTPKVREYFHGTKTQNIASICCNNFDWRRFGTSTGHRFGQGVSFSPLASYASHYTDNEASEKQMFLVAVITSSICQGSADTELPPGQHDTTKKQDGKVIVKYDDHSYYPSYLITYTGQLTDNCGPCTAKRPRL